MWLTISFSGCTPEDRRFRGEEVIGRYRAEGVATTAPPLRQAGATVANTSAKLIVKSNSLQIPLFRSGPPKRRRRL
jgi:hypothetical protein